MYDLMTVIHGPHCNNGCRFGRHYLMNGVLPMHLHRDDMAGECEKCVKEAKRDLTE